ncbi:MAG: acylneuraminate cytidylyltransferase family protein [Kiritimatiellae bacterium]|nr:acylneuraminate cytidylyltransferase family protein [Kiritimatiellia bacterium]
MNTVLGIVPARGGSKSVPRKNLCPVAGKPLIEHTLTPATASGVLDRVLVSTDSTEIAAVAQRAGAWVPFLRPAALARDDTLVIDTVLDLLDRLQSQEDYVPVYAMLLQPTSPLRTIADIMEAVRLLDDGRNDAVVSVTRAGHHPYLMKRITPDNALEPFLPTPHTQCRRQDLPPLYVLNGAIYLVRLAVLRQTRTWCPPGAVPLVMPPERSLDIDTPWDLHLADILLSPSAGTSPIFRSPRPVLAGDLAQGVPRCHPFA